MTALTDLGVQVKSHSSTLEPDTVEKVKATLKNSGVETLKKPEIVIPDQVTVKQLAALLDVSTAEVQKALVKQGALVAANQVIPPTLSGKVTESFGFSVIVSAPEPKVEPKPVMEAKPAAKAEQKTAAKAEPAGAAAPASAPSPAVETPKPHAKPKRDAVLTPRPPIVTILGHVDHGKTTLLDAIRKTSVTESEFGGITQHIGAYQVEIKGKKITFLDTPGHEAFTAMRARGAQVTDIAILIVAADDGVMPQTIEALNHARAAGVQIIVAINKVDKVDADVTRTKQQLAEQNLVVEDWGGDTVCVEISAKSKLHVEDLLDMILLVSEMAELKADAGGPVEATVVEAKLDRGKGPVATILVQSGTLKRGDTIVVGQAYGRIKGMDDDKGRKLEKAGPATPAEVIGLSSVPMAGDKVEKVKNEREARQLAESRMEADRTERLSGTQRVTLADLYKQLREGTVKELNMVLKGDVQGSVEAIRQSLDRLSTEEVRVNLIHQGVGNIGDNDVLLASASNAVVIGFNVKVDPVAKRTAEAERIDVRTYQIIYELLDDVKAAMEGLLEPVLEESVIGHVEIRQLFRLPKGGVIAGSYVTDGKAQRGVDARVIRNKEAVFTGKVGSLRHIKEDVREMAAGFECGITLDGFNDLQIGDVIEFFTIISTTRRI
jgi:translation initiation factor IF-2